MKPITFTVKLLFTLVAGSATLAVVASLLVPAARGLGSAATPLGQLDLTINAPPARSIVYDRYGNVMTSFFSQDREPVRLSDVPQVVIDAVLSIEDRKFYEHHGVDWSGTLRALFKNVDAGTISQGGSTITQQLVKNTLSVNRKRDLKTKAREAILAIRLEHELTKNQILEDYLNLVYFGNGAYGIQAAAERYFNKPLAKLTLPEAALLAGLIQSPSGLDPIKHPDAAARRRTEVLDAMVANGKVTAAQARAAKLVPLPTRVSYPLSAPLDYYVDEVKNELLQDDPNVSGDPGEILGATPSARANAVFRGGLKIYTAYDPALQLIASGAVNAILPKSDFTASLVVIDNSDGGVRAIANGRSFAEMQFDPATEGLGRQAGSSFKVFTLAAALSRGYSPRDSVSGSSLSWRLGPGSGSDAFYNLHGDCHGGTESLTRAIAISDNCAFVRTELSLGPRNYGRDGVDVVQQTARSMGIDTSNFKRVVSTTLGTNGVHPLEMAEAYSVLASDGVLRRATLITKIVGPGDHVIYEAPNDPVRVLQPNVARSETDMLKHVLSEGTASRTLGSFPRPAAGKTGTTDNNVDAWFVGYTPQYTAAVWMGNPKGEIPMTNVGGTGPVFGATYPARIWRAFMEAATASLPKLDFPPPDPAQWPPGTYISENGRRTSSRYRPPVYVPGTTAPATSSTETPTSAEATTTVPRKHTTTTVTPTTSGP